MRPVTEMHTNLKLWLIKIQAIGTREIFRQFLLLGMPNYGRKKDYIAPVTNFSSKTSGTKEIGNLGSDKQGFLVRTLEQQTAEQNVGQGIASTGKTTI